MSVVGVSLAAKISPVASFTEVGGGSGSDWVFGGEVDGELVTSVVR